MQMEFSDGQSEFSRVFNFAILGYSRNSRKLDAHENRDVNFVFFQKSIIVLKKSIFFRLSNLDVAMLPSTV